MEEDPMRHKDVHDWTYIGSELVTNLKIKIAFVKDTET